MTAEEAWALFCATGAPEAYLLYRALIEQAETMKSA
jgi:hypothetical protein